MNWPFPSSFSSAKILDRYHNLHSVVKLIFKLMMLHLHGGIYITVPVVGDTIS